MPQEKFSVQQRIEQYAPTVKQRLQDDFAKAGLSYPPRELTFIAFKDTRILQVYARADAQQAWTHVKTYAVLGASGRLGPKLREGDLQVPEGVYGYEYLNPNSVFHLSIKVSYPNAFDLAMAKRDGREQLGGDIMIHGGSSSVGCLAIGDQAAEDLFVLTALLEKSQLKIIISPTDFRRKDTQEPKPNAAWGSLLYTQLRAALTAYKAGF
jgi:murein L,D-transpeptidase YafK